MQKYIIGNWKLNPTTQSEAVLLAQSLQSLQTDTVQVGCVPSFVHLARVADVLQASNVWVGVQDICAFTADKGAFTGDVSAVQAVDMGAKFALIGHSERRQYYKENNDLLTKKLTQAITQNLVAVLCIGETQDDYQAGRTLAVLKEQLAVLDGFGGSSSQLVIAYEPVWAIGTGLTPSLDEIEKTHQQIKDHLRTQYHLELAVLYGGSVNDKNANEIATCPSVDGVLVGGASLKIDSFAHIVSAFAKTVG